MNRSRKIVLVSHCILNSNARVEGLARYPGVHHLVAELAARGFGIIQLPCPELTVGGCHRWAAVIEQYDTPGYTAFCERLASDVALQVREYVRCGYRVGPVIGVDGSPSCGVLETSSGEWGGWADADRYATMLETRERVPGSGVFMRVLAESLAGLGIEFVSIDHHAPDDALARVLDSLGEESS